MRVEIERMYLYPLSDEEMRLVIENESDPEMKQAYTEMLEGSLSNPDKRIWYAIWNMELKNDRKPMRKISPHRKSFPTLLCYSENRRRI